MERIVECIWTHAPPKGWSGGAAMARNSSASLVKKGAQTRDGNAATRDTRDTSTRPRRREASARRLPGENGRATRSATGTRSGKPQPKGRRVESEGRAKKRRTKNPTAPMNLHRGTKQLNFTSAQPNASPAHSCPKRGGVGPGRAPDKNRETTEALGSKRQKSII